jgi:diguanylate cyclase (GGDEF)-like protein
MTDASAAVVRDMAENIRRNIERRRIEYNGETIHFTASFGAVHVSFAHERADAGKIMERADECLYEAKEKGRNRVEFAF